MGSGVVAVGRQSGGAVGWSAGVEMHDYDCV